MRTATIVSLVLTFAPALALAQSPQDKAAAEALFREGRDLAKHGKYAEACSKFEGSQKLDPSAGTLLNLGDCYEKTGRTASAWATFEEAASAARRVGDARKQEEGKKRARALEGKLPKLSIEVPAASRVSGLKVTRDGDTVLEVAWGTAVPVDPGKHAIAAEAPGRAAWNDSVDVAPGKTAKVEIPPLEKGGGAEPAAGGTTGSPTPEPHAEGAPAETPAGSTAPVDEGGSRPGSKRRLIGIIIGGAGLAAVGVGAYFGISASGKWSDAKGMCASGLTNCTPEAQTLADDAGSAADLSTILVGVGAAAIAGGVILYLTAPSADESATALRLTPGRGGASVTLEGRF